MKQVTYKFTDGSEIDLHDNQCATISGHTKQFAYSIWKTARKDESLRQFWIDIFVKICAELHKRHGIVLEYTNYQTGETVNHFENLMNR